VLVADDAGTVVMLFADNGEGIPRDEAEVVFEDGFRGAVARGQQPQGVGRGLYDCRRLMRAMGGDIIVLTGLPGVTFRLQLRSAPEKGGPR
jgi:signal transduction histidine kinase